MKRMTYKSYLAKCSKAEKGPMKQEQFDCMSDEDYGKETDGLDKSDDGDADDEGGDGDAEGEDGEEQEEKSLPNEDELLKAMDVVRQRAAEQPANAAADRLAILSKSATEGTLDDAGRAEMLSLLQPTGPDTLRKSLEQEPEVGEVIELSPWLSAWSEHVVKSVDSLSDRLAKSDNAQQAFNRALASGLDTLAKAISAENIELRGLVKSLARDNTALAAKVERLESSPLPYRAVTQTPAAPVVQKSQVQTSPRDGANLTALQKAGTLSKSQVKNGLLEIMRKSEVEDPDASKRAGDLVIELDNFNGDWRHKITDTALLQRLGEEATR